MYTDFNGYEEYASGGCCSFLRNAVDDEYEDYSDDDHEEVEPSWHKFVKYGEDTYEYSNNSGNSENEKFGLDE
jgi:hypothetical protein